jgi:hypothetical protein
MYHLLLSFKKKKHHMCWDVAQGQHCKAMSLNPGNTQNKPIVFSAVFSGFLY